MRRQTIVDGYNVIYRSPDYARLAERSLELARNTLVSRLNVDPSLRDDDLTVVFDGAKGGQPRQSTERQGRVRIIYSRFGETADEVIKRLVAGAAGEVRVVSDDRELREHAAGHGGTAVRVGVRKPRPAPPPLGEEEDLPRPNKKGPARRPKKQRGPRDPYWTP